MTHQFRILDGLRSRPAVSLLLIVTLTIVTLTPNSRAQNTDTKPRTVTLKQGQILEMLLVKRLNPRRAKVGDVVVLKLRKPLLADGVTVLPADWAVHGRITDVKRAGKNCQTGSIHWELEPLTMTDSKKIEIQSITEDVAQWRLLDQAQYNTAVPSAKGKTGEKTAERTSRKTGSSVGGIVKEIAWAPVVILALPFLVLALLSEGDSDLCPGGKGREDSIPPGTVFYAEISNDVQRIVD